ncbi:hypothetical protein KSP40_PGU005499 [Platanthera guangdongensis]|uniref:Uncharacterized protein n=1 Tax=Platanthera guangdongensis TaxID=2320717 RepID=A0ABR2N4W5_9ASPA
MRKDRASCNVMDFRLVAVSANIDYANRTPFPETKWVMPKYTLATTKYIDHVKVHIFSTVIRAVSIWRLVLAGRFRLLDQWCSFAEVIIKCFG